MIMDFSKLNEVQRKEEYSKIIGAAIALIVSLIGAFIATVISAKLEKLIALILLISIFTFVIIFLVVVYLLTHNHIYKLLSQYGIDKDKRIRLCEEIQDKCHLSCSYHPNVYEFYKGLSINDCDVLERFLKKKKYKILDIQEGKRVFIDKIQE